METTDPEKIRKINELAESLRKNSLAVNMEEALKIAERIMYDVKTPETKNREASAKKESNDYDITKEDKTIAELMEEGAEDIYNGIADKKPEEQKPQTSEAEAKTAETPEPAKVPEEKPAVSEPDEEKLFDENEREIDLREEEVPELTEELEEATEEGSETSKEEENTQKSKIFGVPETKGFCEEQQKETTPKSGKAPFQKGLTTIFGFGKK